MILRLFITTGLILAVAFRSWAAEGIHAAGSAAPDATQLVWEPESGASSQTDLNDAHLVRIAFLPTSQQLVGATSSGTVIQFNASDLSKVHSFHPGGRYCQPGVAPDGQRVAVGTDRFAVDVYSLTDRKTIFGLAGHTDSILRICWSLDGRWIASGGFDGTVRLWDTQQRRLVQSIVPDGNTIFALAFSPDSKVLAIRTQGATVILWSVEKNVEILKLTGQGENCATVAFSPDSQQWATTRDRETVVIRDVRSGQEILKIAAIWANVVWSPDGRLLAVSSSGYVHLVLAATGSPVHKFRCHDDWVESLAFAPNSRTLATVSGAGRLAVWDLSSIDQLKQKTTSPVTPVATNDGRYSEVLRIFESSKDRERFGDFCEIGLRKNVPGIPGGYWVYVAPRWYVFNKSRIGLPSPPERLPAPYLDPRKSRRLIWIALPGADCSRQGMEHASGMPSRIANIRSASLIYSHGFRFRDDQRLVGATAVLELSLDENTTTEQALELVQRDRWSLLRAEILTESEARAARLVD